MKVVLRQLQSKLRRFYGSRPHWIVAWAMAIASPIIYLAWPGDLTWWVAPVLVLPLCFLVAWRADQKGYDTTNYGGDSDSGGWGPP
jgi:hypothetical protein